MNVRLFTSVALMWAAALSACAAGGAPGAAVSHAVPDEVRRAHVLDAFYQKHARVAGLSVVASEHVSDAALREAAWILGHMMAGREDILNAMASNGCLVAVMAWSEFTTNLPQQRDLKPRDYWDHRARGLGGSLVSCGEENLLAYPGDPYSDENILIHEFAHAVCDYGLKVTDPTFGGRLKAAYRHAMKSGLWKGTYSAENPSEYWAAGSQDWFGRLRQNDEVTNHVNTREEVKAYDPELAKLLQEVYADQAWRYRKVDARPAEERAHLAGYDPAKAPRFRWREARGQAAGAGEAVGGKRDKRERKGGVQTE